MRLRYGILRLRSKSKAPILVSESYPQIDIAFNPHTEDRMRAANKVLFEAVKQLQKEGVSGLYYQFSKEIEFVEDAMIESTLITLDVWLMQKLIKERLEKFYVKSFSLFH